MDFTESDGGILVPKPKPRINFHNNGKEVTAEEYYDNHTNCPQCGTFCAGNEQTCVGYNVPEGTDRNLIGCACGWHGIIHDLVKHFHKSQNPQLLKGS